MGLTELYKRTTQGWLKHIDFILLDLLILQISFVLGYMIRHGWGFWPYMRQDYRSLAVILAVVDLLVFVAFNSMHNVMKRGYLKEFNATVKHVALVLLLMTLYMFSTQVSDAYSRVTIYLTSVFHLVLGYTVRIFWKPFVRKAIFRKSKGSMILVADESSIPSILAKANELEGLFYTGLVLSNRDGTGQTIQGIRVVSSIDKAADYICREWVEEVFIYLEYTGSSFGQAEIFRLIEQCREMAVPVHINLPFSGTGGKSFVEKTGGFNTLTLTANYASPLQLLIKRIADIIGGIIGSIATLIILAIVGPKIKKESPGPILFKQIRIGQNGRKFTLYKIRSMYPDAEERKKELEKQNRVSDGMMFKMEHDPRIIGNRIENGKQVTGIGEMIRRTSLDEFPQFFNVLKGEMSLVGTRPPTEDEWEKYQYHHRARLGIKPGLTGLWQVSGRSEITDFEEVVKLDTEYINNWSLALDLKILFKTFKVVLKREGAQ